jgi:hypothetical protein
MGFPRVVFPISAALKSQYLTATNDDLFVGDALSIIVGPGEYVPEYDQTLRPAYTSAGWVEDSGLSLHLRFTLNLGEERAEIYYILKALEIAHKEDPLTAIICYDYAMPDPDDFGQGYSERTGRLNVVQVSGSNLIGLDGERYFQGIAIEFEIDRSV